MQHFTGHLVSTPELEEGDLVLTHGLLVRLGERHETTRQTGDDVTTVVWFDGIVQNVDELQAEIDAGERDGFALALARGEADHRRANGQEVAEGAVYWSIQGNHRATWTKVTCSAEALCSVPEHTSLSCYWRYAELESEPGCNPVDVPTWRRTVRDI